MTIYKEISDSCTAEEPHIGGGEIRLMATGYSFAMFMAFAVSSLVGTCHAADILFSTLPQSLAVTASPKNGQELKAGESNITVTWGLKLNGTADSDYKTVSVKLCYAPISQADRAWRKTKDMISKDKTCQFKIATKPYLSSGILSSVTWVVEKSIPTATYFVRAYAYNSAGDPVAYGQTTTTDAIKNDTSNLFNIEAVTGRHLSLDIASIFFSGFSVLSLLGFFYLEKRKGGGREMIHQK